jgi:hypothetical protein
MVATAWEELEDGEEVMAESEPAELIYPKPNDHIHTVEQVTTR